MRLKILPAVTIALLILTISPAGAQASIYVESKLQSWITYTADEGYELIYSEVGLISESPSVSFMFELNPGYYKFIAEGGEFLTDLDMFVYDDLGYEIDFDTEVDNFPICEIELEYPAEILVELVAIDFSRDVDEDYFCVLAVGTPADISGGDSPDAYDPGDVINYWTGWAVDLGYEILTSDRGVLNRDNPDTFEIDLERGTYHILSETLRAGDDIDMNIYSKDSDIIAQDLADDNYPMCTFELRQPSSITVEIVPWAYERGNSTEYVIVVAAEGISPVSDYGTYRHMDPNAIITPEADSDLIDDLMDDYMDLISGKDLTNMYDQTGDLRAGGTEEIRITLGRGSFIIFAHGGLRILDLDVRVYNSEGYVISEDTLINNSPVCEFTSIESGMYTIELDPYEMVPGWLDGSYLVIVTRK